MPYRVAPPRSERGSIRDIQQRRNDALEENPEMEPTPQELRIKALYEEAIVLRDQALIDSLGLIVMGGEANNPVNVLRHREYVKEISAKLEPEIKKAQEEIEHAFATDGEVSSELRIAAYKQKEARNTILQADGFMLKNASYDDEAKGTVRRAGKIQRSFWRNQ